jgi:hypothetical protein
VVREHQVTPQGGFAVRRSAVLIACLSSAAACALGAPAGAAAQGTAVAQDISITGQVIASDSHYVRTVRFTLRNDGPGAYDGRRVLTTVQVYANQMRILDAPGCDFSKGHFATCDQGTHIEEGETRSNDVRIEFFGTSYENDQAIGDARIGDDLQRPPDSDANPQNNRATVDLGIVAAPPAMEVDAFVPSKLLHGATVRRQYVIRNTGGTTLTDIAVVDDLCPGTYHLPAGATSLGPRQSTAAVIAGCELTVPRHVRGERPLVSRITFTARSGDQTLTQTLERTSTFDEPKRDCGVIKERYRHKVRRYTAFAYVADLSCKEVRKRLLRCLTRGKAQRGWRCAVSRNRVAVRLIPTLADEAKVAFGMGANYTRAPKES